MEKCAYSVDYSVGNIKNSLSNVNSNASSAETLKQRFDAALKGIREEFDDHRESINDNTCEIEANYELLCKLESKVDRLQEQFEQVQLLLSNNASIAPGASQCAELDEKEKEIFLLLNTSSRDSPLTYREIANAVRESEFLVRGYITNMIEKGVPVGKRYVNDVALLSLDKDFRERQARENIVKLSQRTVREFALHA